MNRKFYFLHPNQNLNKMRSLFIGMMLLFGLMASSQNNFTACGSQSGSWNYDTVFVSCDILIPSGEQLIIEANTSVIFEGHFSIQVDGSIKANGTSENPILFSCY